MIIVGHRGARGLSDENTLESLHKGLQHGAHMLEFDVRTTLDHVPVLCHDIFVTDSGDNKVSIHGTDYPTLKQKVPTLATLQEVFEALPLNTDLYVEVKAPSDAVTIAAVIEKQLLDGWTADHIFLASKNQQILLDLHAALPELPTIVIQSWSGVIATRRARALDTKYIAMNHWFMWRYFIQPMANRGWKLMAYTLNDPIKAKRWASYGLHAVVTDYPDRFED